MNLTDNEIIKALECCGVNCDCAGCPKEKEPYGCYFELCGGAFDLINRQKAEIERYLHSIRLLEKDVKAVESARKNERLLRMVAEEREKVAGHEQIAKVHSAYISILLRKLGATKDNMITIQSSEVKEAIKKYEARAMPAEDSWSLYCEVIEE